jgi:hypothetical protein
MAWGNKAKAMMRGMKQYASARQRESKNNCM